MQRSAVCPARQGLKCSCAASMNANVQRQGMGEGGLCSDAVAGTKAACVANYVLALASFDKSPQALAQYRTATPSRATLINTQHTARPHGTAHAPSCANPPPPCPTVPHPAPPRHTLPHPLPPRLLRQALLVDHVDALGPIHPRLDLLNIKALLRKGGGEGVALRRAGSPSRPSRG